MKTAVWLYLFMFVAFFDLHAQYPMLSPFALSIGAAPSFIGLIMGVYSLTHLPGNLLAGVGVDRYGSKYFIVGSLLTAGIVLVLQSQVTDPWQLLWVRSISGFVLAFLSPACLAMLAKIAKNHVQQGKLMAGNGFVHTLASVGSPAAGAFLVAKLGFTTSFLVLGWGLIATGILAIFGVRETKEMRRMHIPQANDAHGHGASLSIKGTAQTEPAKDGKIPWLFFGIPLALSCSQGILFFELPLMKAAMDSIVTSGLLFSMVSLGALATLSLLFLNRIAPLPRVVAGSLSLALVFFGMAVDWPFPLVVSLFMIGMAKGVIYPAIATLLAGHTSRTRYGRVFSLLSISYSIGAFFGPTVAGQLRDAWSPYFIAFVVLMLGLSLLPLDRFRILGSPTAN
ncbi:MFS transporter [Paenibacillus contaminans]|uniref:MFS transporter n=1 Tax=Paenibacillus contaminans TaxID=450362 RepID=A0A329ML72_9BACL|nr:MFS transporter [Paenibacillus contaminans]RAV20318.1 MFS transporter [Paenibacillus contaminans]